MAGYRTLGWRHFSLFCNGRLYTGSKCSLVLYTGKFLNNFIGDIFCHLAIPLNFCVDTPFSLYTLSFAEAAFFKLISFLTEFFHFFSLLFPLLFHLPASASLSDVIKVIQYCHLAKFFISYVKFYFSFHILLWTWTCNFFSFV